MPDNMDKNGNIEEYEKKYRLRNRRKTAFMMVLSALALLLAFTGGFVIGWFSSDKGFDQSNQGNNNSNNNSSNQFTASPPRSTIPVNSGPPSIAASICSRGVRAEYMQSCFPTKTFPNHYTIVTGLYPAHHGIVANTFYDPELGETFYIGSRNNNQSKWWGGEPIWVTAKKNNLKSASFYWAGSEAKIQGYRPDYWFPYDRSVSFMDRVNQLFKWLEMPADRRPMIITMYFDQPDRVGHLYGPDSNQLIDIGHYNIINRGPFGGIRIHGGNATELVQKLKCKFKHWSVYKKEELPYRLHYCNNRYNPADTSCNGANHGWDNLDPDMRTIFFAAGPGFKKSLTIKPFKNIELYNIMAALLLIKPAKNDGTIGRLNFILQNSTAVATQIAGQLGSVCRVPQDHNVYIDRENCSDCVCPDCKSSVNLTIFNQALRMTQQQEKESENRNFPWGIPRYRASLDTCTLYQNHYITGYSNTFHVPLFVGYHLTDTESLRPLSRIDCFRRDSRLNVAAQTSNCSNYYRSGYNRGHLAPNGDMSFDLEAQANTFILSNIAPQVYAFNAGPWLDLEKLTRDWARLFGSIYVISGSIVKADWKTVVGNPSYWLKGDIGSVVIPTHFYKILAKCQDSDQLLCDSSVMTAKPCKGKIDVIAFILPHINSFAPQCQTYNSYLFSHVASVRDIEELTGINFFPNMAPDLQDRIESEAATEMWTTF
ncbi:Ectonucleotide pyrophosphatase/phosphodiesterase family member 3 [Trichoplax sp. H2]|nr:Ectonucleotide pyrophosphatase/phosphodiesterase family member 3 [Trichoplax sp. H2]|eukprot:RDD43638.1 Ectonucleotide pyrophosphatase/phosphodiesterase family member 3 [Trichoplax sp. H2]